MACHGRSQLWWKRLSLHFLAQRFIVVVRNEKNMTAFLFRLEFSFVYFEYPDFVANLVLVNMQNKLAFHVFTVLGVILLAEVLQSCRSG